VQICTEFLAILDFRSPEIHMWWWIGKISSPSSNVKIFGANATVV